LKASLRGEARAKVLTIDGWMAVNANVPPKERRGLVVIDPPYESSDDFLRLTESLAAAHRKWPGGIYMLWYPIKTREAADALARRLRRLSVSKILRSEILLDYPQAEQGLVGSGLILVNPPYVLEDELRIIGPALSQMLAARAAPGLNWVVP
jgi:23S rRNA (adenine2030-N6)-methyltransferase